MEIEKNKLSVKLISQSYPHAYSTLMTFNSNLWNRGA